MLPRRIALKYLLSGKSHNAVNVISAISVVGVAVATAAIVIVLSVFNGFASLAARHLSALDPEYKVVPVEGKVIANGDSIAGIVADVDGVDRALPVIEERGLMIFDGAQMPVRFRGVPDGYDLEQVLIDGVYLPELYHYPALQSAVGSAIRLGMRPTVTTFANLYVPRRVGRINPANPAAAFRGAELMLTGVFQVDQAEYDADFTIIPIDVARDLLQYPTEATAIEVTGGSKKAIAAAVGADYKVLTRLEQQAQAFRMISIEKWVTFLLLAFILLIASFNIITTLSLMVIEKRQNMQTLHALGAPRTMLRSIFIWQGWLISLAGGIVGIILGTALSFAQQVGGFIHLAGDPSNLSITSYPVEVQPLDLLIVMALVAVVGLITSQVTRLFKL